MAFDIYAAITDRIIDQLQQGIIPWHKPWNTVTASGGKIDSTTAAISYSTGKAYSFLNQMLLGRPGEYITFKQALDNGGNVKKGSKARMVVFWKFLDKEKRDSTGNTIRGKDGQPVIEHIPYLKYYNVFHLDDCENVKPKHSKPEAIQPEPVPQPMSGPDQIEAAEAVLMDYVTRAGISLYRDNLSDQAYYNGGLDTIVAPRIDQYQTASEYYSTLFHEAAHSTGHPKRLNRDLFNRFGSKDYAKEELVAEITAAAILHGIGIETPDTFGNSAAYVQSWIRRLQNDSKMIVSAAGKAEKAANYITGTETCTASEHDAA